ncbi:hypothetical protein Stsp01_60220 [Streptomyces sp. NBRC 13847]|nr:hypothetical protein Stsp01_60220 [Streptomyces sp. NBRC 13847]
MDRVESVAPNIYSAHEYVPHSAAAELSTHRVVARGVNRRTGSWSRHPQLSTVKGELEEPFSPFLGRLYPCDLRRLRDGPAPHTPPEGPSRAPPPKIPGSGSSEQYPDLGFNFCSHPTEHRTPKAPRDIDQESLPIG